jgi:hypothetical protein
MMLSRRARSGYIGVVPYSTPPFGLPVPSRFPDPPLLSHFDNLLSSDPQPINCAHLIGRLNYLWYPKPGSSEQP